MKKRIVISILSLFSLLATYEIYAVTHAYKIFTKQFKPYASISVNEYGLNNEQLSILVKVQDPTFYNHSGIEWPSPLTTTTITQSLVKRLFFEKFTKGFKKIEQTLIARFIVNPNIDKNTQLIAFMSTAYLGNKNGVQIYGFKQGSRAWFNKDIHDLSNDEYLTLVAMLPAPNLNKPDTQKSIERINMIKNVLNGKCQYTHVSQIQLSHCL